MDRVEERLAALEEQVVELKSAKAAAERRVWGWRGIAGFCLLVGLVAGAPYAGIAQGGTTDQRLAALETKLARVSVANGGADLIISGANLNIINGGGTTQTANGLGNLIIGYNEARAVGNARGGSHNLVLGQQGNYTSFGGIIGGFQNTISGPFAHVLTGFQNGSLSFYSCVTTGQGNNAANNYASVAGGFQNTASGLFAAVAGGNTNTASGAQAVVSGGLNNIANGLDTAVSGGLGNTASGNRAAVSAGSTNTASGSASSVSGGVFNTASNTNAVVSGGQENTAAAASSTVGGGHQETIAGGGTGNFDWLAAGQLFQDAVP
jgi:hypothetical protein